MAEFVLKAKDEASAVFDRVRASATMMGDKINAIRFGALGVAAAAGAGYLSDLAKAGINTGDQLNKLSQKVGISVERLSELKFAAELSDVSLEQFQLGMKGLNETLAKATDATSQEAQLLKTLGVTAREPEKALRQLADAFTKMPDGAVKSATAVDLLGKAGQNMIPFLNGGSAAIDNAARSAQRLGLTMSADTAKAAEEFNDNMKKLTTGAEALGVAITSKLIKSLAGVTGELVKAKEQGRIFEELIENMRFSWNRLKTDIGNLDPKFLQNLLTGQAGLDKMAEMARRTASGKIGGAQPEAGNPDLEAQVACQRTGGTWDASARRCIPKAIGPKQETLDQMMSRFALRSRQERDRLKAEGEAKGEREHQIQLDLAADRSLQAAFRRDAEKQKADELAKQLKAEARAWKDTIDPMQRHREELARIDDLEKKGFLTAQEALESRFKVQEAMDEGLKRLGASTKEVDNLAKDLGLTFSSALEDAIVGGKKLSEVLKAVGADIARIVVRRSITEPLGNEISKLVGGGGGSGTGGGLVDWVRKFFGFGGVGGFATGGSFMVGGGGGTDSQLVAFRATPGERVTVETPAQQRADTPTVVLQIGAGTPAGIRAEVMQMLPSIQSAVLAGVLDAKRRGGGFGSAF